MDSYSGSLTSSKKKDYFLSEHFDLCSSAILMQLPKSNLVHGQSQGDRRSSVEEGEANRRPHECLAPNNTFMGRCLFSEDGLSLFVVWSHVFKLFCPGTFGKAPWRSPNDLHEGYGPLPLTHDGMTLHENPYTAPDTESDTDEIDLAGDSIYERPYDNSRTEPMPQCRTST